MSSNNIYTAGLNNVGSYQVSGMPFATGSVNATTATKVQFPYVTRWVQVINHASSEARVGFSQIGVEGTNYFKIHPPNNAGKAAPYVPVFEFKLTEIWVSGSGDVDVIAGLTNIPVERVDNISPSGSNWSGSAGVG